MYENQIILYFKISRCLWNSISSVKTNYGNVTISYSFIQVRLGLCEVGEPNPTTRRKIIIISSFLDNSFGYLILPGSIKG